METNCQQLLRKILFWIIVELALNILGVDQLADYGEFIDSKKTLAKLSLVSFS
jgi:hypothetical protein